MHSKIINMNDSNLEIFQSSQMISVSVDTYTSQISKETTSSITTINPKLQCHDNHSQATIKSNPCSIPHHHQDRSIQNNSRINLDNFFQGDPSALAQSSPQLMVLGSNTGEFELLGDIAIKRAEQNRVAQREFRQRKQKYIKWLESKVEELDEVYKIMALVRAENQQLYDVIARMRIRSSEFDNNNVADDSNPNLDDTTLYRAKPTCVDDNIDPSSRYGKEIHRRLLNLANTRLREACGDEKLLPSCKSGAKGKMVNKMSQRTRHQGALLRAALQPNQKQHIILSQSSSSIKKTSDEHSMLLSTPSSEPTANECFTLRVPSQGSSSVTVPERTNVNATFNTWLQYPKTSPHIESVVQQDADSVPRFSESPLNQSEVSSQKDIMSARQLHHPYSHHLINQSILEQNRRRSLSTFNTPLFTNNQAYLQKDDTGANGRRLSLPTLPSSSMHGIENDHDPITSTACDGGDDSNFNTSFGVGSDMGIKGYDYSEVNNITKIQQTHSSIPDITSVQSSRQRNSLPHMMLCQ